MKDYLNSFQAINNSIEKIRSLDVISCELKSSAVNLSQTIQPCINEIQQVVFHFQQLIQPCFESLEEMENIWESKEKICQLFPKEIMEEVGILTGKKIRIRELILKYQQQVILNILAHWRRKAEAFKQKYFKWDDHNNKFNKDHLGLFDKDELFKKISQDLDELSEILKEEVTVKLTLIFQEIKTILSPCFYSCFHSLDQISKNKFEKTVLEYQTKIELEFNSPLENLPEIYVNNYLQILREPFNNLNNRVNQILGVFLKEIEKFCLEIENIMENLIKDIFAQKIKLASEVMEISIYFYNDLLEKQERYRQELLSSQHQLEKVWIDQQKQELDKINQQITAVLSQF